MVDESLHARRLATALLRTKLQFGDPDSVNKDRRFTVGELLTPRFLTASLRPIASDSEDYGLSLTGLGDSLNMLARTGKYDTIVLTDAEHILPTIIEEVRRAEDDAKCDVNPERASDHAIFDRFLRKIVAPRYHGQPVNDPERIIRSPVTPNEIDAMQIEALRAKRTFQLCREALETVYDGIRQINQALNRRGPGPDRAR